MSNTISRERWRQVKAIFQSAVEHDRESRQRFLAITCQDDPALRAEVERLLAADEREPNFLEDSPINFTNLVITEDSPESFEGTRVGPYRILEEIGRGGMGAVYLAKREDEFEKRVAIKIIKRGMDSDEMLRRFRNERQILAHLDHPNIARLLDGGTTSEGLPYFVMEYVEGWGIDEYCDEHELTINERLKLFQQVCAAVSYAHQHLAIHRDIKPSNILVTADGIPKLLDFGIAKLLSPDASDVPGTVTGLQMMTPEYASPEQARGDAGISTASDVYSLGIVLYELLTGHRPYLFPNRRPEVVAGIICETEPEKPSAVGDRQRAGGSKNPTHRDGDLATGNQQLAQQKKRQTTSIRRQLRGDLDNIVLMALRKEPSRRYNSVDQLSEDIRRHLEGLPVIARADTFYYRASKFIQRNKVASLAAGLVTLAICVGMAATLYQNRVARAERARAEQQRVLAEQRFNEVRQLANAVVFKYHDAIETLPGSTQVREMLVKDALAYLDRLSQNASADRSLQRELALAYIKVGDVQGRAHVANLGDTAGALRSYLKAVELFEKLHQSDPADAETRENLRDAYQKVGTHYVFRTQQWREGHDFAMKAVSVSETLVAHDPTNAKYRRDLARAYVYAGDAVVFFGGYAEETRFDRKALEILEEVYARDPKSVEVRRTVIIALQRLGTRLEYWADTLKEQNVDRSEIEPKYQEAISRHLNWFRIVESLIADQPQNATFQRYLGSAYMNIGGATARSGDGKRALPYLEKSFSVMKSIADRDPANQEAQRDVSEAEEYLGIGYDSLGDTRRALQHYLRAIAILEPLNTADRLNVEFQEQRFRLQKVVGNLSLKAGDYPGALRAYTSALRFAEEFPEAISPQLKLFGRGEAHEHLGRYYAALASSRRTSSSARSANWRMARSYYELALTSFLDAQQRQMLNAAYDYKPALLRREIAQCDAALAN